MARPRGIPSHRKMVHPEITCEVCSKVFTVKPYLEGVRKYCSRACKGVASRELLAGENNPTYRRVERTCEQCGKNFHVKLAHVNVGKGKFCSHECHNLFAIGKPGHPAPHRRKSVELICQWCSKPFQVMPSLNVDGRRKFCSRTCKAHNLRATMKRPMSRTSIEIAVEQVLVELEEPFETQKTMGTWRPDFYLPKRSLIIECDGTYWHNLPKAVERDRAKDAWMQENGYSVLRLSEPAIKQDARKAVLDGLQHHV